MTKTSRLIAVGSAFVVVAIMLLGCAETAPQPVQQVASGAAAPVLQAKPLEVTDIKSFKPMLTLQPISLNGKIVALRMQSFEGQVCIADGQGGGFISHCRCEGSACECQTAVGSCVP